MKIMEVSSKRCDKKKWFSQWIFLFLTIVFIIIQSGRLAAPPWETVESWRQSDTYSIAQNFVQFDMNPLHPQLNYDGTADNYAQLELQIMPFLSALIFQMTGTMDPAICRILSLIFFLGSAVFLYLLICDIVGTVPALFAHGVYLFLPLSLMTASSIQPEACALFFYCGGVYFRHR